MLARVLPAGLLAMLRDAWSAVRWPGTLRLAFGPLAAPDPVEATAERIARDSAVRNVIRDLARMPSSAIGSDTIIDLVHTAQRLHANGVDPLSVLNVIRLEAAGLTTGSRSGPVRHAVCRGVAFQVHEQPVPWLYGTFPTCGTCKASTAGILRVDNNGEIWLA
ncbi:MAG: hypothetical protein AB7O67_23430 [Vicinamibacterales bacterium]